jgi:hypothetical protein
MPAGTPAARSGIPRRRTGQPPRYPMSGRSSRDNAPYAVEAEVLLTWRRCINIRPGLPTVALLPVRQTRRGALDKRAPSRSGRPLTGSAPQAHTAITGCSDCLSGVAGWVFDPG